MVETSVKLHKCMTQIRNQKIRPTRSVDLKESIKTAKINIEKIVENINILAQENMNMVKKIQETLMKMGDNIKPTVEQVMLNMKINVKNTTNEETLSCDNDKRIKIISSTLTNKNYADICMKQVDESSHMLEELNVPCTESIQTMENTVEMFV